MRKIKNVIISILLVLLLTNIVSSEAILASDDTTPAIFVESQTGKAGEEIIVNISIKNNPGIAGATLQVEYDSKLTLQQANNGDALSTLTFTKAETFSSPAKFLWDSERGMSQQDGTLLSLTFLTSTEAASGEKLPIHISYATGDIFNENLEDINLQLIDGSITIAEREWNCATDGHVPAEAVKENEVLPTHKTEGSYDLVVRCEKCGEIISSQSVTTDKIAHIPAEAVKENEIPATHNSEGSYDLVVYCAECKEELSRSKVTIDKQEHVPAEAVKENEIPATHNSEGSYDLVVYCAECKEELSRSKVTIDKQEHVPAEAVKENEIPATHNSEGSYDLVVYCAECKEELSRSKVTIDKEEHVPAEAVKENIIQATCIKKGSYNSVVRCAICNQVLSVTSISVNKLEHVPAELIKEKVIKATCTKEGSYENVVYCSKCGAELSRNQVKVSKVAHHPVIDKAVKATYTKTGLTQGSHCSLCGTILKKQKTVAKLKKKNAIIKVSKKTAVYKVAKVKKSKQTFKIGAKVTGNGKITYKKVSGSSKLIVSRDGRVTIRKGTKKGIYRITVQIKAAESLRYKAKTIKTIVTVKVK